jgi:kinesin family protein 11
MLSHFLGREDKLNSDNRAVVDNFQVELAQQVGSLCNTVATSLSRQNEHLQCVENLCHSFMGIHDKVCKIIHHHGCSFVTLFQAFTNLVDSFSYL